MTKHPTLALLLAPVLGALFAIFLPAVGFVLLVEAGVRRLVMRGEGKAS